jgi:ATP-dependent protease ClpP protease subunit
VYGTVWEEVGQGHGTRKRLYEEIEDKLGPDSRLIAYFTSFRHPVTISDEDCDMLEEVLRASSMRDKHLYLMLNSPGGDGIAAERIVKVCRAYSNEHRFTVIVPKRAKSAATMICMGACRILMSATSELGPIDPQVPVYNASGEFRGFQAAFEIIESYRQLMDKAAKTKGNVAPFLAQLGIFDAREIARMKSAQSLSENIAIKLLRGGCMASQSMTEVKKRIKAFTNPKVTMDHGRPIYHEEARTCGLDVDLHDLRSEIWAAIWALYVRLNYFTEMRVSKVIESKSLTCSQEIPR